MIRCRASKASGFTLLELVYVIALVGILGSFAAPLAHNMVRGAQSMERQSLQMDRARYAAERMARELREMKAQAASGAFDLSAVTPAPVPGSPNAVSMLRFVRTSTVQSGAAAPVAADNTVTIEWADGRLWMAYDSLVRQPLLDDVAQFSLVFVNASGVEVALSSPPTLDQRRQIAGAIIRFAVGSGTAITAHTTRVQLKNRELL